MSATMTSALWALGRGTGVIALVMMTLSLCLGVTTRSGRAGLGLSRFGIADLHKTASLTGTGLVVVHVSTLLLDPYAQLRLIDLVVPFLGSYRPWWLGLGTLAMDVLLVVVVSSLLRARLGPRTFKGIHWATYALWPLAFVHALGTGTNAFSVWYLAIAAVCLVAVAGSLVWRLSEGYVERGWQRRPRKVATR